MSALVKTDKNTVDLQSYTAFRAYKGRARSVKITTPGISGNWWLNGNAADNGFTVIKDGLNRSWERLIDGEYLDSWAMPTKDGISDDSSKYEAIAASLPTGSVLKIVGAGTRVIETPVVFSQANITVICDPGAKFIQAPNTLTIDTFLTFSGVGATLVGFDVDGNVSNNPTVSYIGRGELLKVSGDLATVKKLTVRNTHVKEFSCGLYITGKDSEVSGVVGENTGRVAIRDVGDRTIIKNVRCRNIAISSGGIGNKVIAKDGSSELFNAPFTWVAYENIYGHASNNGFHELIVVDDFANHGGLARCRNLYADYPLSVGVDVIKFVNVRRVDIDGLTTIHAGDGVSNTSLRLQENVGEVNLSNIDLAGHINFDTTSYVRATIDGNSVIGRTLTGGVCVDDFPDGYLSISDGCALKNFTVSAVATNQNFTGGVISIGECVINGNATGSTASRVIVQHRAYSVSGTRRRLAAGLIRIATPVELTNTRNLVNDGRWIALSDSQDCACIQGNDGRFMAANSGMNTQGPNGVEGWKRGMELFNRAPAAGAAAYIFVCTTSGASCSDLWTATTAYTVGSWRSNGASVYACVTAGTSAGSGGPSGTGTGIVDGTCVWDYVDTKAVFKAVGSIAA